VMKVIKISVKIDKFTFPTRLWAYPPDW
jgi:hypothetical protein